MMRTRTLTIPTILIVITMLFASVFSAASVAHAQTTPAATTADASAATGASADSSANSVSADRRFQMPGALSCIPGISFEFVKCIGAPLAIFTSDMLITIGAKVLQLAGSLFDFGMDRLIMNFKETLEAKLGLLVIINGAWTFFRDLANILMIGIFVFIAISLILGLKEYGQKKLIARVLIIAVLMNFSLLFTKIVIDASNFVAYSIYTATAGSCSKAPSVTASTAGAAAPAATVAAAATAANTTFSIADCMLKPLRIMSVWDTSQVATDVYMQAGGGGAGALTALLFGLFGFIILILLAVVIFYGAFLIVARALLLFLLMVTAPLAYASYLAPHFEASQFGWTNWWKSLINNATFAPLLMMFISITILIIQSASNTIGTGSGNTLTPILMDSTKNMAGDGWRVLFLYILGTGFLFISFRVSSSLAGSISGIRLGQMALGVPLAFVGAKGFQGAGRILQDTKGRAAAQRVERLNSQMSIARDNKDWAQVERLRKEKAKEEKKADRSYNFMNTGLGKALAGKAGLSALDKKAGVTGIASGESKGGFVSRAHDKAVAADPAAKATRLTDENKNKIRENAKASVTEETKKKDAEQKEALARDLEGAKAILEKARVDAAAAEDMKKKTEDPAEKDKADAQVVQNTIAKAPERHQAEQEVRVIEQRRTETQAANNQVIATMIKETEKLSGQEKDKHLQAIEQKKAEHAQAIKAIDARITDAKQKVNTIDSDIKAPLTQLQKRQADAAAELAKRNKEATLRKQEVDQKETALSNFKETPQTTIDRLARERADAEIKETEKAGLKYVAEKVATTETQYLGKVVNKTVDHDVEHIAQHHFDEQYKQTSNSKRLLDRLEKIEKNEDKK